MPRLTIGEKIRRNYQNKKAKIHRLFDARRFDRIRARKPAPLADLATNAALIFPVSIPGAEAAPTRLDLQGLAREVLGDASAWFATPNPNLGDRKPSDLVGTEEESKVYDLLFAVDQGLY